MEYWLKCLRRWKESIDINLERTWTRIFDYQLSTHCGTHTHTHMHLNDAIVGIASSIVTLTKTILFLIKIDKQIKWIWNILGIDQLWTDWNWWPLSLIVVPFRFYCSQFFSVIEHWTQQNIVIFHRNCCINQIPSFMIRMGLPQRRLVNRTFIILSIWNVKNIQKLIQNRAEKCLLLIWNTWIKLSEREKTKHVRSIWGPMLSIVRCLMPNNFNLVLHKFKLSQPTITDEIAILSSNALSLALCIPPV